MRLKVTHQTRYSYDAPVPYALQRLRLTPQTGGNQNVLSWSVDIVGAKTEVRFTDQFSNETHLVSIAGEPSLIELTAHGEVEVRDTAGVFGGHMGFAPLWLFEHQTALTAPGPLVGKIVNRVGGGNDLDKLHALAAMIAEQVTYRIGTTAASTTAEEAVALGEGVCQDHAHIFLAAARSLGYPARYVSGYLLMDGAREQVATHAWAEAHVNGLGWVGFDISNAISPDERYVRLAVGRDYRDAMPVSGIRLGAAQEQLDVHITVEQ